MKTIMYASIVLFSCVMMLLPATASAQPTITSHVNGSILSGSSVTFNWTANGVAVTNWWLYVGTSAGGRDIFNSGDLESTTSKTVSALPYDGSTVHVRLWYKVGFWQSVDFQYMADREHHVISGDIEFLDDTVQSTAFSAINIQKEEKLVLGAPDISTYAEVTCLEGSKVLGGGWDHSRNNGSNRYRNVHAFVNRPTGEGWMVGIQNDSSSFIEITVYAICANFVNRESLEWMESMN